MNVLNNYEYNNDDNDITETGKKFIEKYPIVLDLYKKFNEKKVDPTDKQIDFIKKLCEISDITISEKNNIINKCDNKDNFYNLEVNKIINYLKSKIKISENQKKYIQKIVPIKEVSKILKRNINDYSDIYEKELKKLIDMNPRLSFSKIIKNFIPKRDIKILEYSHDYEYGIQISRYCKNSEMYYIKFYEMLLLDFDDITLEEIKRKLDIIPNSLFRIYKTFNGYHVFLISSLCSYNTDFAIYIAKILECDPWYIIYFRYHGYCIRLSKKDNRNEKNTHKFICNYGTGSVNEYCKKWITIFEKKLLHHNIVNN